VRGELKIEPLAPESCFRQGTRVRIAGSEHAVESIRTGGRATLLALSGVDDRETARQLRGRFVLVPEDSLEPLPEDQYYRFQLIGLAVATTDGRELGTLVDVLITGSADVYAVQGPLGEVLIPATADAIVSLDLAARTMIVNPLPGLLPER
jgi:16S rRNA processing protein RimM